MLSAQFVQDVMPRVITCVLRRDGITDNIPAASPFIIALYVADAEGDIKSGKYVGPSRCKYLWGLKY